MVETSSSKKNHSSSSQQNFRDLHRCHKLGRVSPDEIIYAKQRTQHSCLPPEGGLSLQSVTCNNAVKAAQLEGLTDTFWVLEYFEVNIESFKSNIWRVSHHIFSLQGILKFGQLQLWQKPSFIPKIHFQLLSSK